MFISHISAMVLPPLVGTNLYASQKGMSIGAIRHVADINTGQVSQESQGVLNQQLGTGQFATQKGMSMGKTRHVGDIDGGILSQSSQGHIGLQAGSNQFATQKGMSFGKVRGISDSRLVQVYDGYEQNANLDGADVHNPVLQQNGHAEPIDSTNDTPIVNSYNGYDDSADIDTTTPLSDSETKEYNNNEDHPDTDERMSDVPAEAYEEVEPITELESDETPVVQDYSEYGHSGELQAMG